MQNYHQQDSTKSKLPIKVGQSSVVIFCTFPFISLRAALAASTVVYSRNAYPLDLLEILSIIILTANRMAITKMPQFIVSTDQAEEYHPTPLVSMKVN